MKCLICEEYEGNNKNGLATHLKLKHNISYPEYEILYIKKESLPECSECGKLPRYDKGKKKFNQFCIEHANLARSKWSRENIDKTYGGLGPGWKKGLTKEDHSGIKAQSDWMKENNPFYKMSKEKQDQARLAQADSRRISKTVFNQRNYNFMEEHGLAIVTPFEEYNKRSENLEFKCLKCDHIFERSLGNMIQYEGNCPKCQPTGVSKAEDEIVKFLKSLGIKNIIKHDRKILDGLELDIYLPDYGYAIEYNGLYWHSEQFRPKESHANKTNLCQESNIKLFHIWSDHWENKQDIVKSMIKHHLNKNASVYPRTLSLKALTNNSEFETFFKNNHLHGHAKASIAHALVDNEDNIIACLSLLKSDNEVSIKRFAIKQNTHVPGGFTKLLKQSKQWCYENNIIQINSYSYKDAAYCGLYGNNGFTYVKDTKLDYFYTNGKSRFHRWNYRAQNGLSERAFAEQEKVYRVYGCGNKLWKLIL